MLVERGASDMALDWRREMDERSTDIDRAEEEEEVHSSADTQLSLSVNAQPTLDRSPTP